jgi:hypothetical protein
MRLLLTLLFVALLAAGCGSSKEDAAPTARTPDEWAQRIVNRFLRPLNQDLVVVTNFSSPQVRVYIATRNEQTLNAISTRLGDLKRCTNKLDSIGPPPSGQAAMARVYDRFRRACTAYERVADKLLDATDLLTKGRAQRAESLLRSASPDSRDAAQSFAAGVKIAQSLAPFRRAGLRPSV